MVNLNIPIDEQLFQQISSQAIAQRLSVEIFLARFIEHHFIETNSKLIFRALRNQVFHKNITQLSLEEINAEVKNRRG